LCTTPEGKETLKRMVLDDIEDARPPRHDAGAGDAERPRPADATISRCFPTRTPSPAIDGPTTEPTRYQLPDTTAAKRAAAQVLADRRGGEAASGSRVGGTTAAPRANSISAHACGMGRGRLRRS
jgi:hypothetical protein